MQIHHASLDEFMGQAGYERVAVDMEYRTVSVHQLPDLFRALELGGTLPLVRLAHGHPMDCKQALDAGAGGVIVPISKEYQSTPPTANSPVTEFSAGVGATTSAGVGP